MDIRSFRANSLRAALQQVQQEFGPEASVLRTREVWDGWLGGLMGKRRVEVFATVGETASNSSNSSNSTIDQAAEKGNISGVGLSSNSTQAAPLEATPTIPFGRGDEFEQEVEGLSQGSATTRNAAQFQLFTELLDSEWSEHEARRIVSQVSEQADDDADIVQLRGAAYRSIADAVRVQGPIQLNDGQRRVVALVGPTGVGKTTTIAKLAANFHLRDKKRVALVTVDTYRIAAVEQLRTYADIIDLPMHVVSSPSEMQTVMSKLDEYDLVLLDTAGRSPHDEIRIQELQGILGAAEADEVHLVLSATTGARALQRTAEKFAEVGLTALLLTKLDECAGLGELLPLLEKCDLPVSYVTNGQNVPDDIQDARVADLPNAILGTSAVAA